MNAFNHCLFAMFTLGGPALLAQTADQVFKAAGTPANPRVSIAWDRYYDAEGLAALGQKIAAAHPELVRIESLGKSRQGRDLWCLTITDFKTGAADQKPALYLQGNIHGNEIQGAEFSLYTAWYLTETFADTAAIKKLLAEKTFYIVPTLNPDSRDDFMHHPNTANTPRGAPGAGDQAGFRDLDGDGNITFMRTPNPRGVWRVDPIDPRLMKRLPEHEIVGEDKEARARNPDAANFDLRFEGGAELWAWAPITPKDDPNRDWLWTWDETEKLPREPFRFPETRAARDFIAAHPNIAVALSMHNNGQSIIRATFQGNDTENDVEVFTKMIKRGQQLLPGFEAAEKFNQLPWVFEISNLRGEEINWMFGKRGIYSFILELAPDHQLQLNNNGSVLEGPLVEERMKYNDALLFGDGFVPWHEVNDPVFGKVEVGGMKKNLMRTEPGFLIEAQAHRAMAFSIYCANQTPTLVIKKIQSENKEGGCREITVTVANEALIGTHSDPDLTWRITRPDWLTLSTTGTVLSAVQFNTISLDDYERDPSPGARGTVMREQTKDPARFVLANIPGHGVVTVRWIVQGGSPADRVTIDSVKGGSVSGPVSSAVEVDAPKSK